MSKELSKSETGGSKGGPGDNAGQGQKNQITVSVRYQETVVSVPANVHESVTALLEAAIKATGNQAVSKDRFQLKLDAVVLDPHKKVDDYPIKDGSLLVLVLIAGGGGNAVTQSL